jgi:hypothetical protein
MPIAATNPDPGLTRATSHTQLPDAQRRARTGLQPTPHAEPPHLQAVHAGKHGVIIKGMHHATFWEWHV